MTIQSCISLLLATTLLHFGSPQVRPPEPIGSPLALDLVTSKQTYDRLEPIVARLYLVNKSQETVVIPFPRHGIYHDMDLRDLLKLSRKKPAVASICLNTTTCRPVPKSSFSPCARLSIPEKKDRKDDTFFIGGGVGGWGIKDGMSSRDFLEMPPGCRRLISEIEGFLPEYGNTRQPDMQMAPGHYRIRAALLARKPALSLLDRFRLEERVRSLFERSRPVSLFASKAITVIPPATRTLNRLQLCRKVRVGMGIDQVARLLGKPTTEYLDIRPLYSSQPSQIVYGIKARYLVGSPRSVPSDKAWGKVEDLFLTVTYDTHSRVQSASMEIRFWRLF